MKALLILAGMIFTILFGIMIFNYSVDPLCYYQCQNIDSNKRTWNIY